MAKNIYPEYPCFVQDFISSYDCQRMGFEQFGIFNWMLMQSWIYSEKPCHLPNDPEKIAWMLRTIDYQLIIKHISEFKKWKVTDDGKYIYNPKLLSIYENLCSKSLIYANNRKGKGKKQLIINCESIDNQADNDNDNDNTLNYSSSEEGMKGGKISPIPEENKHGTWRTSKEIYFSDAENEFDRLIEDPEWISEMRRYYPGVNIRVTLEKMWNTFWGTEAGWKCCKARRSKELNWQRTIENNIQRNRVFIQKGEVDREKEWIEKYLKEKEKVVS